MRTTLLSGALALLLGAGQALAQDRPREVLERAIKAHGGLERLSRFRADRVKLKGHLLLGEKEVFFTAEAVFQMPGQYKNSLESTIDNRRYQLVEVINGDKVFITINGQPQKVEPAALSEMRQTLQIERAIRLVPLLTDQNYEVTLAGQSKVNERPVLTLKVSAKGKKDLFLSFDKDTGLLFKTEHVLTDGHGKEVRQEGYFTDFRDFDGYRRPSRLTFFRDGKKIMEAELIEVKYLDKIDESEFARP